MLWSAGSEEACLGYAYVTYVASANLVYRTCSIELVVVKRLVPAYLAYVASANMVYRTRAVELVLVRRLLPAYVT
jgi:hypothetical protein